MYLTTFMTTYALCFQSNLPLLDYQTPFSIQSNMMAIFQFILLLLL